MATITVTPGQVYGPTDEVTSTDLNDLGSPTAALDTGTIVNADISASADIAGSKLLDSSITKAKIENVADMKVLGNTSGSATAPQEVSILDDDTMATASATTLATSESIKAYVDSVPESVRPKFVVLTGGTHSLSGGGGSGTRTKTFNIADFTSDDSDFGTDKITGIVFRGFTAATGNESKVLVTLPNGTYTDVSRAAAFSGGDSIRDASTFTIPINDGQASFSIQVTNDFTDSTSWVIRGAIIQPNL
jgi:hypothetical protein